MGKPVVHFLGWWIVGEGPAPCRQCHPWAVSPGCCKEAGWVSHGEKVIISTLHGFWISPRHTSLAPWVPALTSLEDGLHTVRWNNPLFSRVFDHSNRNPDQDRYYVVAFAIYLQPAFLDCSLWIKMYPAIVSCGSGQGELLQLSSCTVSCPTSRR